MDNSDDKRNFLQYFINKINNGHFVPMSVDNNVISNAFTVAVKNDPQSEFANTDN